MSHFKDILSQLGSEIDTYISNVDARAVSLEQAVRALGVPVDTRPPTPPVDLDPFVTFYETFRNGINEDLWNKKLPWPEKDIINGEKQVYTPDSFSTDAQGRLMIVSQKLITPVHGQYYSSGALSTHGKFKQKYGTFEIRCKNPEGKGYWPAFWLYPSSGKWTSEIDIMEGSGVRMDKVHHAVHGGVKFSSGWIGGNIDPKGFNTYKAIWTPKKITFFVNGDQTGELVDHAAHDEMHLIVNTALGSQHGDGWIPNPDETTPFPGVLTIDYIKVWEHQA